MIENVEILDEYEKAKEKRNKAQVTSDIKTESEIDFTSSNNRRSKRQRKPPNVYSDSESSDSDRQVLTKLVIKKKKLPRPPVIQVSGDESDCKLVYIALWCPNSITFTRKF